jgi:hypothetical protein
MGAHLCWAEAVKTITVLRKMLKERTVVRNSEVHGAGGLNIKACRVPFASEEDRRAAFPGGRLTSHGRGSIAGPASAQDVQRDSFSTERGDGRWPANVIFATVEGHTSHFVLVQRSIG